MRTLTKKKLDELAKAMPTLSEKEQSACIGGTKYYNASGSYLGDINDGSESIRISDANTFASCSWSPFYMKTTSLLMDESSNEVKNNIFDSMASSLNIDSAHVNAVGVIGPTGMAFPGQSNVSTRWDVEQEKVVLKDDWSITINTNGCTFDSTNGSNYYDHMVTLIHEKNHINNYVDYYWQSTQEEYDLLEFKAYKCSVNSTTVL